MNIESTIREFRLARQLFNALGRKNKISDSALRASGYWTRDRVHAVEKLGVADLQDDLHCTLYVLPV